MSLLMLTSFPWENFPIVEKNLYGETLLSTNFQTKFCNSQIFNDSIEPVSVMEGCVMSRKEPNSRFDLRSSLWQLKDDFTDVSLICSKTKETLRGHKIILAGDLLTIHDCIFCYSLQRNRENTSYLHFIWLAHTFIIQYMLSIF